MNSVTVGARCPIQLVIRKKVHFTRCFFIQSHSNFLRSSWTNISDDSVLLLFRKPCQATSIHMLLDRVGSPCCSAERKRGEEKRKIDLIEHDLKQFNKHLRRLMREAMHRRISLIRKETDSSLVYSSRIDLSICPWVNATNCKMEREEVEERENSLVLCPSVLVILSFFFFNHFEI